MLDGRNLSPVILIGFQLNALTLVPCNKFVWAGADGLFVEVMSAGDQVCRKDGVAVVAQICKKTGVRAVGCDLNCIVVDHFNGFHCVAVLGNLRGFLTKFQGSFYVGGLHFLAIVEFHALSQLEYPLGIAYDLIGFC